MKSQLLDYACLHPVAKSNVIVASKAVGGKCEKVDKVKIGHNKPEGYYDDNSVYDSFIVTTFGGFHSSAEKVLANYSEYAHKRFPLMFSTTAAFGRFCKRKIVAKILNLTAENMGRHISAIRFKEEKEKERAPKNHRFDGANKRLGSKRLHSAVFNR